MPPGVSPAVRAGGFDHVKAAVMGGGGPVLVQTMWKERLSFAALEGEAGEALIRRIRGLEALGCGLLRFAVPAPEDAEILGELARRVSLPLCADIHFDYTIALRCLDFPVAKLRINPGNIGDRKRVEAVVSKAAARGVPIRIGVNAGSLPAPLREDVERGRLHRAEALVRAALAELAVFQELGFHDTVVSMKASGIADTIRAARLFAERSGTVLHIGVTEAGPLLAGTIRNTAALLPLLAEGIGDTLRVSLSDTVENEVIAGREILAAVEGFAEASPESGPRWREAAGADQAARPGPRRGRAGVTIVSCPRCGRNGFDVIAFTERWKDRLYALEKNRVVAIMGCAVNGPGEARHADLGITGAGNSVMIFRRGKVTRTLRGESGGEIDRVFGEELEKL